MKKILMIIVLLSVLFVGTNLVYATSGFLRKDSIKTCDGILYGQHSSDNHWHKAVLNDDGGYNAVGDPMYTDPCGSSQNTNTNTNTTTPVITTPIVKKSSDVTLLSLKVDNNAINISDNMTYLTKNSVVSVIAIANDSKALVKIDDTSSLKVGDNNINIKVTAEDGSIKNYLLNIKREQNLSTNTNIEIKVDGEIITFIDGVSEVINVSNNVNKLDVEYIIEDDRATVEIKNNGNLKNGNNEILIIVTAEDGTKKEYKIKVYRYSQSEDIIYGILGFGVIGATGYGIVRLIKKKKNK